MKDEDRGSAVSYVKGLGEMKVNVETVLLEGNPSRANPVC